MSNAKRTAVVEEEVLEGRGAKTRPLTLFLDGELEVEDICRLGDQLVALVQRGMRSLVVDLSEVSHLDYRGIRPLMERAVRLRKLGGEVKLAGLSPYLATILRVAGAHTVFECYREPSTALESFSGRSVLAH
jgi:anti-sigma B factor antagonist